MSFQAYLSFSSLFIEPFRKNARDKLQALSLVFDIFCILSICEMHLLLLNFVNVSKIRSVISSQLVLPFANSKIKSDISLIIISNPECILKEPLLIVHVTRLSQSMYIYSIACMYIMLGGCHWSDGTHMTPEASPPQISIFLCCLGRQLGWSAACPVFLRPLVLFNYDTAKFTK